MTSPTITPETNAGIGAKQWIEMQRQMVAIRLFEEQVNELYTRALMPGLAHLYIGEEAVAVGVCSALRPDDYITSTHRGHGHCLAKGASPDRMFADYWEKKRVTAGARADRCTSPIRRPGTWAPMPLSGAAPRSPRERLFPPSTWGTAWYPSAFSGTVRWPRDCSMNP